MKRELRIGQPILYVDSKGVEQHALITHVWGCYEGEDHDGNKLGPYTQEQYEETCINVCYMSKDESKTDDYGRQLERDTSVCFAGNMSVRGRCWEWL